MYDKKIIPVAATGKKDAKAFKPCAACKSAAKCKAAGRCLAKDK